MKKTLFAILSSLLVLTSCSDWTEMKSITIVEETLEQQNPALYKEYCAALKEYKATEHALVYVTYDAPEVATNPSGNLTTLPDSVDVVEFLSPETLPDRLKSQMSELRSQKGFRFVVRIAQDEIEAIYNAKVEEIKGATEEGVEPELPDFTAMALEYIDSKLKVCETLGFDGITFQFKSLDFTHHSGKEEYEAAEATFLTPILEWLSKGGKTFFFETRPQFIDEAYFDLVRKADAIILPTATAKNTADLEYEAITSASYESVPAETRYMFTIETPSSDKLYGYYSDGSEQISAFQKWFHNPTEYSANPTKYIKGGVVVKNVQRACFSQTRNYDSIVSLIRTLNPNA